MEDQRGNELTAEFRTRCIHHLGEEYLPRIERAARMIDEEDLWWRPNPECTSPGNLLLHLEGNVRQWILSGLAGREDARQRQTEFDATSGATVEELLERLRSTVEDACAVISALDAEDLLRRHDIQVFESVSAFAAILHVVEHFSWHTGQGAWIAKMNSGQDLRYYEEPLE
jgi:uncharacterized damage-inducible protein DinB